MKEELRKQKINAIKEWCFESNLNCFETIEKKYIIFNTKTVKVVGNCTYSFEELVMTVVCAMEVQLTILGNTDDEQDKKDRVKLNSWVSLLNMSEDKM